MLITLLETAAWGVTMTMSSTIVCMVFNVEKKSFRNIVIMSTICGMIRGYTGKTILELLLNKL
jgi:hypothetical protein